MYRYVYGKCYNSKITEIALKRSKALEEIEWDKQGFMQNKEVPVSK
jgi:hypothetical protein